MNYCDFIAVKIQFQIHLLLGEEEMDFLCGWKSMGWIIIEIKLGA